MSAKSDGESEFCGTEQQLRGDFYDQMTSAQKSELATAIADADSGQLISSEDLKSFMAKRFNISE